MTGTITLRSEIDGFELTALHAEPTGTRRGGVILIHEAFGLDAAMKKDVERWATLGFEVVAPSMFDRQERGFVTNHDAEGLEIGLRYIAANGDDNPVSDVQACIDALKDQGSVYLVGYCYGGSVAWLAAARTKGLDAVSSYYGGNVAASAATTPRCPIICHFGVNDPYIQVAASEALIKAAQPQVPVYLYENSGHGFNNEGPDADPSDVQLARKRTLELFERTTGR